MSWTISLAYAIYILISVFIAIPASAITISSFPLFNSLAGRTILFISASWIFGAFVILWLFEKRRAMRLKNKALEITPSNFESAITLTSFHSLQYLSLSPTTRTIVVVDMKKNVARCESMDFIQRWETFENNRKYFITVSFNNFEFPSITMRIRRAELEDLSSKFRYALSF